ncbi:MAG: DUF5785 family protein [Halobacteriota archaeon]
MSWPHDPDGDEGSEGGRKYGLAIFAKKLDGEEFPLTPADCRELFGDDPIRIDHDRVVRAADILEDVPDREYESEATLLAAIGSTMRDRGDWTFERERYAPG